MKLNWRLEEFLLTNQLTKIDEKKFLQKHIVEKPTFWIFTDTQGRTKRLRYTYFRFGLKQRTMRIISQINRKREKLLKQAKQAIRRARQ